MKKVLFVFSMINYFREMLPVAEYYASQGWEVHALIGWRGWDADAALDSCYAAGFEVHQFPEEFKYGVDHDEKSLATRVETDSIQEKWGEAPAAQSAGLAGSAKELLRRTPVARLSG